MNNKLILFGWLVLSFLMTGNALSAETRLIHVELSYSGSAASYNLYKDGVQVCVSNIPGATQMDCNVEIDPTPMTFVLTAVDAAGVESPQSAPYILVPPTLDPGTGNYLPQANFTASATSGMAPLPVSFDASGSSDLDGVIIAYAWDFGDGATGAGKLIDYTFSASGTYTVTLTVVDDRGAAVEKTATITVGAQPPPANSPPVAVITATPLQTGTSRIGFDASKSSDADGTIVAYAWNFGDGDTAAGISVEHEFKAAGDYTVVLTVTDDKGASSQDQMIMTVVDTPQAANLLPVAEISASSQKRLMHFAWDYTGSDPALAGFRLYQNGRKVCEAASPLARETDCLTYVDSGAVALWVTSYDQAGVESAASAAMRFDSTGLFPAAGGEAPLVVHFTAGASVDPDGTISSYAWNFGDGATGDGQAVDHVFSVAGSYTVTMTLTDNSGGQSQATTVITVTDINPPTATNASFSTVQEKSVTGTLTAYDPEGSPLSFAIAKDGALGTATITNSASGVFTYVPKLGSSGADSFTFKANDGTFDSNEAVVSINIEKKNSAPTAANQTLAAQEDTPASGTLSATDVDNDAMTLTIVTPPAHGVAVLSDAHTGAFQYTPEGNYHGEDSFTFKANDGQLDSAVATASITVSPINDLPTANPDSAEVESGKQVAIAVLVNDTDIDTDPLTVASVTPAAHGQAVLAGGEIAYTANADFEGTDSFSYTVSDGVGGTASAVVTVTVLAPTVVTPKESVTYAWDYDATIAGLAGFKLYMNGEFICETADPAARSLTCQAPVTTGVKTFYVKAIVNAAETAASNTITFDPNAAVVPPAPVNAAPVVTDQALTLAEDVAATGTLLATDANSDPLSLSLVTPPMHGVVTVAASGVFTYTPQANFNGTDTFTFTANDGKVDSVPATVSLTITPVNDAPAASAVNLSAIEDDKASGQLSGSDLDGDSLTYSIVSNGSKGVAAITNASSGTFTYTPNKDKNGEDSFTYKVSDGKLSAEAKVVVEISAVNDAPLAANDTLMTTEDTLVSGLLLGSDVDGDRLTYSITTNGSKGAAAIVDDAKGLITYTPSANQSGQDAFVYRVSDGVVSAEATVTVTIAPVNDAPVAGNITFAVTEDTAAVGQVSASDPDGDRLSYAIVSNGSKGTATIADAATGAFSYAPAADQNGQDTFVCRVSDGVLSVEATVTVTIAPVNDAPRAAAISVWGTEDVVASGQLPGSDVDGDRLTYAIVSNGSHGNVVIKDAATGAFSYTPTKDANGQDSFVYSVSDGKLSAAATVTVTIEPVNDAPVANPDAVQVESGRQVLIDAVANDTDVDADTISVATITPPAHGQAVMAGGKISYTANADFVGTDSFSYAINDGAGGTATGTVTVTVLIPMQAVTYTWDYAATATGLVGFKLYMNGNLVGETSNPAARTLTVKVPKSAGEKSFHLTAVASDATETSPSNSLKFTPTPEVAPTQSITYTWDYAATADLAGFKLYMNGGLICETSSPAARTLSCEVPKSAGGKSFYLTAINAKGAESTPSNSLNYTP